MLRQDHLGVCIRYSEVVSRALPCQIWSCSMQYSSFVYIYIAPYLNNAVYYINYHIAGTAWLRRPKAAWNRRSVICWFTGFFQNHGFGLQRCSIRSYRIIYWNSTCSGIFYSISHQQNIIEYSNRILCIQLLFICTPYS